MKIYTRTGDDGSTSLFSGGRVPKYHLRVESYGTVDELNSVLGVVRAHEPSSQSDTFLARIQHQLFNLGADLATPLDAPTSHVVRMDSETVTWLEDAVDHLTAELPPLTYFVLPGGSLAAAQIHVARTVCRRAERLVTELSQHEPIRTRSPVS
jgi:cob(I)alamin adenosyltransferase